MSCNIENHPTAEIVVWYIDQTLHIYLKGRLCFIVMLFRHNGTDIVTTKWLINLLPKANNISSDVLQA